MKRFIILAGLVLLTSFAFAQSAANIGTSIGANDNNFTANQHMTSVTYPDASVQTTAYKQMNSTYTAVVQAGDFINSTNTFAAITGSTLTITTQGNTYVEFNVCGSWYNSSAGGDNYLTVFMDGVNQGSANGFCRLDNHDANYYATWSISYRTAILSAGSHSFYIASKCGAGTIVIKTISTQPVYFKLNERQ